MWESRLCKHIHTNYLKQQLTCTISPSPCLLEGTMCSGPVSNHSTDHPYGDWICLCCGSSSGGPDHHRSSDPVSERLGAPDPRGPLHRRRVPVPDRGHPGDHTTVPSAGPLPITKSIPFTESHLTQIKTFASQVTVNSPKRLWWSGGVWCRDATRHLRR